MSIDTSAIDINWDGHIMGILIGDPGAIRRIAD
jgi:hypothetical protein